MTSTTAVHAISTSTDPEFARTMFWADHAETVIAVMYENPLTHLALLDDVKTDENRVRLIEQFVFAMQRGERLRDFTREQLIDAMQPLFDFLATSDDLGLQVALLESSGWTRPRTRDLSLRALHVGTTWAQIKRVYGEAALDHYRALMEGEILALASNDPKPEWHASDRRALWLGTRATLGL